MKTIALYNLKGGVGKTASAVNLAHCAASSGRRTVLLDLDPQGAASFYLKSEAGEKFNAKKFTQGKGILRNLRSSAYQESGRSAVRLQLPLPRSPARRRKETRKNPGKDPGNIPGKPRSRLC
jgi:cellulose biosynthesis protein BcsQ